MFQLGNTPQNCDFKPHSQRYIHYRVNLFVTLSNGRGLLLCNDPLREALNASTKEWPVVIQDNQSWNRDRCNAGIKSLLTVFHITRDAIDSFRTVGGIYQSSKTVEFNLF